MKKILLLLVSHLAVGFAGFAAGIYVLPILTAPPAPTVAEVEAATQNATYTGEFRRDLEDSDALHWGEGQVFVTAESISLQGEIAPGPDYKLYLSPKFVETEADFTALKSEMTVVGDVKTFENFIIPLPANIDTGQFDSIIIWCEAFGEFITATRYQPASLN